MTTTTRRLKTAAVGLSAPQELLEVQRYLAQRVVGHAHLDGVECGQAEAHAEHGQPDELVDHGPAAHAQVPEQQVGVLVVAVQVGHAALHWGPVVAEQRRRYAHQRIPQEAGGHQRLHGRLDGQSVAHAVHGQRQHRRQQRRGQQRAGLRKTTRVKSYYRADRSR